MTPRYRFSRRAYLAGQLRQALALRWALALDAARAHAAPVDPEPAGAYVLVRLPYREASTRTPDVYPDTARA